MTGMDSLIEVTKRISSMIPRSERKQKKRPSFEAAFFLRTERGTGVPAADSPAGGVGSAGCQITLVIHRVAWVTWHPALPRGLYFFDPPTRKE